MSNLTSYSPHPGGMVAPFTDPADDSLGRVFNANGVLVDQDELATVPVELRTGAGRLAQDSDGTWSRA